MTNDMGRKKDSLAQRSAKMTERRRYRYDDQKPFIELFKPEYQRWLIVGDIANELKTLLKNGDTRLCSGASVSAYDALVYIYGKMGFQLLDGDALDYVREATRFNLPDKSGRQYAYRVVTPAGE